MACPWSLEPLVLGHPEMGEGGEYKKVEEWPEESGPLHNEDFAQINLYFRFFTSILYTDNFLNFS